MYYFDGFATPIGRLHVVVSDVAVHAVLFPGEEWEGELVRKSAHPLIVQTKAELKEYFRGKRKVFDLPLDPSGTPFQKKVWKVLRQIPYGETISYKEEARRMSKASAVRAVANANGRNPLPIIVPCHRVIASDSTLGGYSGGLHKKEFLLALEHHHGSKNS